MQNKKYIALATSATLLATLAMAAPAFAATDATVTTTATATARPFGKGGMMGRGPGMRRMPGVFGKVSAISGTTVTVTETNPKDNSTTTYTVNAGSATVMKNGVASTVSGIAVGDMIMAEGTLTGTTLAATRINDGIPPRGEMGKPGEKRTELDSVITGNGQPVIAGVIKSISGSTITITNASNVTYTATVGSATIAKKGAKATLTDLTVGDSVIVQGTINGTAVTASSVIDAGTPKAPTTTGGEVKGGGGFFGGVGNFFSKLFGF